MRRLVIDSASEACSVALFDADDIIDFRHEIIGRGHAERLVPLIAELAGGGRADQILVGCGPGSFAGVRIGVAAARALGLAWQIPVSGFSTLALIAAGQADRVRAADGCLVVMEGGHGEYFVQSFDADLLPLGKSRSLSPAAASALTAQLVIGNRAEALVARRGFGTAIDARPDARSLPAVPPALLDLAPSPHYGRAPDARPSPPAATAA